MLLAGLALAMAGVSAVSGQGESLPPTALSAVGVGDSFAGGQVGCLAPCRPFVEAYGELASTALGRPVEVTNLATSDSLESGGLLARVRTDPIHREALSEADLITIMIGWNDWQGPCVFAGLEECLARNSTPVEENVRAILAEIALLRNGEPTAVRVVTYPDVYNGFPDLPVAGGFAQDQLDDFEAAWRPALADFNAMLCEVAQANGALCVDTLTPFNGPDGDTDPGAAPTEGALLYIDHLHPSEAGHERIAQAIAEVGFAPLGD